MRTHCPKMLALLCAALLSACSAPAAPSKQEVDKAIEESVRATVDARASAMPAPLPEPSPTQAPTKEPTALPVAIPAGWPTYSDPTELFTLRYPPDCNVRPKPTLVELTCNSIIVNATISLENATLPGKTDSKESMQYAVTEVAKVAEQDNNSITGGLWSFSYDRKGKWPGKVSGTYAVADIKGSDNPDKAYWLCILLPLKSQTAKLCGWFDRWSDETVDRIMSSFKVIE